MIPFLISLLGRRHPMPSSILPVLALLVLSACAHSRLRLELDVYRGDPSREVTLTPDQLASIRRQLDKASHNVSEDLVRQKDLARSLKAIYETYFCLFNKLKHDTACDRTLFNDLERQFREHMAVLDVRAARVYALLDTARTGVSVYERMLPGSSPGDRTAATVRTEDSLTALALQAARMRASVGESAESVRAFARAPTTAFQNSLANQWGTVVESVDKTIAEAAKRPADTAEVRTLRNQVDTLAARLQATAPELAKALDDALDQLTAQGGLAAALKLIGKQVNGLPELVSSSPGPAAGLARLVGNRDLYDSQIDRLKDPADPIWRIVSAPENTWRWNQVFTRTWFFAQGNSDVIVVRDGPLDYRIQNASNNPAALIQSQLQISRAVANAAITVLGSAAGVRLSQPAAGASGTAAEASDVSQVEELAGRDARITEIERLRASTSRTMQAQLRAVAAELSAGPTAERKTRLLDQLEGLLGGYKDLLSSLRQESHNGGKESKPENP